MFFSSISEALSITSESEKNQIDGLQAELEAMPDTFYGLFWLYTHDFMYLSPSIEQVTGHSFKNFEKHGMVFFTSIIPPNLIENIYQTMNSQAEAIQNHPEYLFAEELLHINAAVYNLEKEEIPVNYNAVLLDSKVFDPISYLVFCSWIDIRNKSEHEIQLIETSLREKLLQIKSTYFRAKPDRYQIIRAKNRISSREKEIAQLLSEGHSTKSISDQLNISFNTVESHRKNLLIKLEAKNTAELVYKLNQF
ncbi:LuxR family transcriptional regulator [Algoriphagus sp. CAU 1675]|uniref:LuxR C-terminal-related transcriptional regulator n=1 Tax=Algoriphagus sp. CAU 1675 TaxID=3032597 RepID=UPI0023DC3238|nr:LuxR family transcriptional regulator [Algoriphagus sp. CAU 1675]MDF2156476.1 LuxR C-terminal-related transcriptional regulator [Algoriphagus sp. CAU 1675]